MFGKKKEEMMVYVIMGFLEAGKTNLIRDLVVDDMFDDKIKTMILACEEGELEYEPDVLEKANCVVEYIEDEENLVMGISSTATEYVVNQPSTVFLLLFRIRFLRCT